MKSRTWKPPTITTGISRRALLMVAWLSALLLAAAPPARSATLYSFCSVSNCTDGAFPSGGLVRDANGNLYGTTSSGGAHNGGTVFEVTPAGTEKVLYSFCSVSGCTDGNDPTGSLVRDAYGNLYGTTALGGAHNGGTVFEVTPAGTEKVLYSFCSVSGCTDGKEPFAGLVRDAANGNSYGTTASGGAHNGGTVFEITASGKWKLLYSFCSESGCADGTGPNGLVLDGSLLYGTTHDGGYNYAGTIFQVTLAGGETVLYHFCSVSNCTDGAYPEAGLVRDANGNFYGTTVSGGTGTTLAGPNDGGTVFELNRLGTETVLYNFCSRSGCADGEYPYAGLVQDANGDLYGTTETGGSGCFHHICGIVFEVTLPGTETVLDNFSRGYDGEKPHAGLVQGANGELYGTTTYGGSGGGGTVFAVAP